MSYFNEIRFADSVALDAFGRQRISEPVTLFDAQFTYSLHPLLFQQVTSGPGATIAHDTTNRCATMSFASTPTGGKSFMQSYEHLRYQPGKSQEANVTFKFVEGVANCIKFAGYSDGSNGFETRLNGTTWQLAILSDTGLGDQIVDQDNWNMDKLDGTGKSGYTLDESQEQIYFVDFQALYVGRVRMGFLIKGRAIVCHEFNHSNESEFPYIQTANLPIRCGMTCTGTVSTTMDFNCCAVISEGGIDETAGYDFTTEWTSVTAGSGTRTHLRSIQPRTTFNGFTNRAKIILDSVSIYVAGNQPVLWELCIGQAFATDTTSNVNTNYSVMDTVSGTLSGNPLIVFDSDIVVASASQKQSITRPTNLRYPITLDVDGAARVNGRISLLVQGIGGTSLVYGKLKWKEIR